MIKTREQVGMADGKSVVAGGALQLPTERRSLILEDALQARLPEPVFVILELITAHDGSLSEALSRAIVARANEIGLQSLVSPVVRQAHHEGSASSFEGAKQ